MSAGKEIHAEENGRARVQFPKVEIGKAVRQGASAGSMGKDGDPDQPLILGRVSNTSSSDTDQPSETISLNFTKVELRSISVQRFYESGDRLFLLGSDGNTYSLPDGIYSGVNGSKVRIKGKKILQNVTQSASSGLPSGKRTYEPVTIRSVDAEKGEKVSGAYGIHPVQFTIKSENGKYTGSGSSWFEVKNGAIVRIGGLLYKPDPRP